MVLNYSRHRVAIEKLYEHVCTISEFKTGASAIENIDSSGWVPVVIDQPCHLAFENNAIASEGDIANPAQSVTLLMAPENEVKTGARIEVKHSRLDWSGLYERAGAPAVLESHQEIPLRMIARG